MLPRHFIILNPIAFIKRSVVGYFFAVVEFTFGDGVLVGFSGFKVADGFPDRTIYAYTHKALATGKHNVACCVVPGVVFVLLKNGELHIVNKDKLI